MTLTSKNLMRCHHWHKKWWSYISKSKIWSQKWKTTDFSTRRQWSWCMAKVLTSVNFSSRCKMVIPIRWLKSWENLCSLGSKSSMRASVASNWAIMKNHFRNDLKKSWEILWKNLRQKKIIRFWNSNRRFQNSSKIKPRIAMRPSKKWPP